MWWWRSHGQRQRTGDSDPGPPTHPIPPCPRPTPHVIFKIPNSTNTTLMSSGEDGHQEGTEEEGKRQQEVAASLSPVFSILTSPHTSWHIITWDALKWVTVGRSLGNKAVNENTHRLCGWISNIVCFFFCLFLRGAGFVLYYLVCLETLGSVTCFICCGRWRNWPVSSWLKQREIQFWSSSESDDWSC